MDRIIEIKVNGNYLTKDNKNAGVQYEANATSLRIEFDAGWDGYAKKVTFWDANGQNPVERTLTADLLEDITVSTRIYLCPIPGEALAESGECTFVIDGYVDGKRQRSISDTLMVREAPFIEQADEPVDPTPTQAEQLQVQIDTMLGDMAEQATIATNKAAEASESAAAASESAREAAESAASASTSASTSTSAASEAAASASAAKESETAAKASETAAKVSETAAKASETAAKESEMTAKTAAATAAQDVDAMLSEKVAAAEAAKTAAASSASSAKESETAAKASETAAKASEAAAASSASDAADSAANIQSAAQTATEKAEEASTSASNAASSADAAAKSAEEAKQAAGGDFPTRSEAQGYANTAESNAKTYTDQQIAAIPTPDVSGQISTHNTDTTSHEDIREAMSSHASDTSKHITAAERTAWNAKLDSETDPTVPAWAKASSKPCYTAEEVGAIPTSEKGAASGVATLGADGKVPSAQLPSLDYVPTSEKGKASGVATLGTDGKVPTGQLPEISSVKTFVATLTTTWTENEDTGVKSQSVPITGVLAKHTAKVDHAYTGSGTSDDYAAFVEAENQYLTYITNGYAETYDGGIKFYIFGDAPTVSIPIVVEAQPDAEGRVTAG